MFCDRCGTAVQPDQRFCPHCGRQFSDALVMARSPNRVREHVRLLGILWLALSALNVVGGLVLLIVGTMLVPQLQSSGQFPQLPADFLTTLLGILGLAVLAKAVAGFAAAYGLLKREPWARTLTIVLSFLALFHFPLGTALGVYSLWVLFPAQSEREYEQAAREAAAL